MKKKKYLAVFLALAVALSGCTTLRQDQYAEFGYKGEPVVEEGMRIIPLDWLGNLLGVFSKIILWNWKVKRHRILEDTEDAIDGYLKDQQPVLGDLSVQLNRYAPHDSWRRLFTNKGVKWPYRYTLGFFSVLLLDTLLISRIFGADRYDPFTHTVHLYSDLPSVALHELGHAKDFGQRRYRGSYALFRIIPFADLYQEGKATDYAFEYVRAQKMIEREIESYKVLYPAYGTYAGGYLFGYGSILGALIGHVWGRSEASSLTSQIED